MKPLLALLLALLAAVRPSFAQPEDPPAGPASEGAFIPGPVEMGEPPPPLADEAPEPTLDLARANAQSIIEAFVARKSVEGHWPLRDKKSGRLRRLQLVLVDAKKTRPAGRGRYKAPAVLRDLAAKEDLRCEFLVDLSGTEWKVVGMKLLPSAAPGGSAQKGRRRAAPAPSE